MPLLTPTVGASKTTSSARICQQINKQPPMLHSGF